MASTVALLGLQSGVSAALLLLALGAAGEIGVAVYSAGGAVTEVRGRGWRVGFDGTVSLEPPCAPVVHAVVLMFLRYHDLIDNEERDGRVLAADQFRALHAALAAAQTRRARRRTRLVVVARTRTAG